MISRLVTENSIMYVFEIDDYGNKFWYHNDTYNRENGPAIELTGGMKAWCRDGKYHREDGPAVEYADGSKAWYLDGKLLPIDYNDQLIRILSLKAFL